MIPESIIRRRLAERLQWHRDHGQQIKDWPQQRRRFAAETIILRRHFGQPEEEIRKDMRDRESLKVLALAEDADLQRATIEKYAEGPADERFDRV